MGGGALRVTILTGGGPRGGRVAARSAGFAGGVGARVDGARIDALRVDADRATGMPGGTASVGEAVEAMDVTGDATGDPGETTIRGTFASRPEEAMIVDSDSDEVGEAARPIEGDGGRGNVVGSAGSTSGSPGSDMRSSELGDTCK